MNTALRLTLAAAALSVAGSALGQNFPTRPITLICPWPAGGSTDTHPVSYTHLTLPTSDLV